MRSGKYYIWLEKLIFDNGALLEKYFDGSYDGYFAKLFEANGAKFRPKMKKIYYYTTLIEYFCGKTSSHIPQELLDIRERVVQEGGK